MALFVVACAGVIVFVTLLIYFSELSSDAVSRLSEDPRQTESSPLNTEVYVNTLENCEVNIVM